MGEISNTVSDEMLLAQLVESTAEGDDQISGPKIQRVPAFLRQNRYITHYWTPKMISFGPIHHRNQDLKQGERFKIKWASLYIGEYSKKTNQSPKEAAKFLHRIVQDNIGELKKLFSEDVIEGYNDKELARVLFVDGCSLLYYMDKVNDHDPQALKLKLDQLMFTWRDIMLLENQIPRTVLELLSKEKGADLEFLMLNIREMGLAKRLGITIFGLQDKPKPFHILDSHRYIDMESRKNDISNKQDHGDEDDELHFWQTYKNLKDLKTAGIRVKANKREEWQWYKVSFTSGWFSGELRLPGIIINNVTSYLFQNLIAHEMCPDFPNNFEFCSYFTFMDSIIDDAEDVKELRLAGVIQNLLGSDEEVAQLFNQIGHGLPSKIFNHMVRTDLVAYSNKYIQVKRQIEKHYSNKWKTWLAEARNTYFNTPWSLIAFCAALLALVLTFIQTWYAMHPK